MPLYDHRCRVCRKVFEDFSEAAVTIVECRACGGPADRVWIKFGGMLGKSKGIYPRFDVQLGCNVESSQHLNRIVKERGLYAMGPDEHKRWLNAPSAPDPLDDPNPDPELIECAKKAWEDVKHKRVPIPDPTPALEEMEADILRIEDAPKMKA